MYFIESNTQKKAHAFRRLLGLHWHVYQKVYKAKKAKAPSQRTSMQDNVDHSRFIQDSCEFTKCMFVFLFVCVYAVTDC